MSKYIIELDDRIKIVTSVGVTENGVVYTTSDYVHNLEELNSDYINEHFGDLQDTAYQKGINDGSLDVKQRVEGAYQKGLNDAWEAAKKIFGYEIDGGIPIDEVGRVFGYSEDATFCTADIIRHNTASEAIEKLKAYEEKQNDKIEVGDEVNWLGDCFIVTRIFQPRNMKEQCDGIDDDGDVYRAVLIESLVKTGRHFDIASILEDMKT